MVLLRRLGHLDSSRRQTVSGSSEKSSMSLWSLCCEKRALRCASQTPSNIQNRPHAAGFARLLLSHLFCSNRVVTLGVLTLGVKQLIAPVSKSRCHASVSGLFAAIYNTFIPLQTQNLLAGARACRDCALVVAPRALSDMMVTFHGKRKGSLVFWWRKLDFS